MNRNKNIVLREFLLYSENPEKIIKDNFEKQLRKLNKPLFKFNDCKEVNV